MKKILAGAALLLSMAGSIFVVGQNYNRVLADIDHAAERTIVLEHRVDTLENTLDEIRGDVREIQTDISWIRDALSKH